MDENRQNAYRFLLYQATLDIRPLSSFAGWRWELLNPVRWRWHLRRVRLAGEIAEWLHNMAEFSGNGFERFDEERFWREYERLRERFPFMGAGRYQDMFERRLVELQTGKWPNLE